MCESRYLEASFVCVKVVLNGFLACEPFLVNGVQPLWHFRGGHGEVGGSEMVQEHA